MAAAGRPCPAASRLAGVLVAFQRLKHERISRRRAQLRPPNAFGSQKTLCVQPCHTAESQRMLPAEPFTRPQRAAQGRQADTQPAPHSTKALSNRRKPRPGSARMSRPQLPIPAYDDYSTTPVKCPLPSQHFNVPSIPCHNKGQMPWRLLPPGGGKWPFGA